MKFSSPSKKHVSINTLQGAAWLVGQATYMTTKDYTSRIRNAPFAKVLAAGATKHETMRAKPAVRPQAPLVPCDNALNVLHLYR